MPSRTLRAAALFAVLLLAACSGDPFNFGGSGPTAQPTPSVNMSGRWLLGAPNAPPCGMAFAGAPNAQSGTIAPEGGCPGNFFMSRHWAFEQGGLVIKDHNNEPLAQLAFSNNRFEGKSTAGASITLTR